MTITEILYTALTFSALAIAIAAWYVAIPLVKAVRSLKYTIDDLKQITNDIRRVEETLKFGAIGKIAEQVGKFFGKKKNI